MATQKKQFVINTRHGSYRARIWKDKTSGTYGAEVLGFPEEVVPFGTSLADAKRMIKDVIELHCAPLPLWLMRAILRQAKLSLKEFRKLIGRK